MTDPVVDLRSDTVTRPTDAMRAAMAAAPVGDDVYGEDPTVNALEEAIAARMGKAAAVYFPSATQANLAAILAHCRRGEEVIAGARYHVLRYEAGGSAALGGVVAQPLPVAADFGLEPEDVAAAVKPDDPHFPVSRLLSLENSAYGEALPLERIVKPAAVAREAGLAVHLDGARIFNAAVKLGLSTQALAEPADSVTVCLSKGLGAPLGSALCGSKALTAAARRLRKTLGGGMRQVGVVAAAGLHALEHHVERLAEDHARAAALAAGLAETPGLEVLRQANPTNMVYVSFDRSMGAPLKEALAVQGVRISSSDGVLRLALHLDVDDQGVERAISAFRTFFAAKAA